MLVEELKNCIAEDVKVHIDERKTETAYELAVLADEYVVAHRKNRGKPNLTTETCNKLKNKS